MSSNNDYAGAVVLVLGASGFIGRWVTRRLLRHGASVHLTVRNETSAVGVFDRYSITGVVHNVDLSDSTQIDSLYQRVEPDITFNLAGYGMGPGEHDEATASRINSDLPAAICRASWRFGSGNWSGQQIVHAGSAAEYGENLEGFSEIGSTNPSTLYGISKLAGTRALAASSEKLGAKSVTARIFNAYGPGERSGRLLPSLIEAARAETSIRLTDGSQKRDFTYVEDIAIGLLRLGRVTDTEYPVMNLATGTFTTVHSFVNMAAQVLGMSQHQLKFGAISMPERERDWNIDTKAVPVARLQKVLNWLPTTSVALGISQTCEF